MILWIEIVGFIILNKNLGVKKKQQPKSRTKQNKKLTFKINSEVIETQVVVSTVLSILLRDIIFLNSVYMEIQLFYATLLLFKISGLFNKQEAKICCPRL